MTAGVNLELKVGKVVEATTRKGQERVSSTKESFIQKKKKALPDIESASVASSFLRTKPGKVQVTMRPLEDGGLPPIHMDIL